jgi:hypothetical protein
MCCIRKGKDLQEMKIPDDDIAGLKLVIGSVGVIIAIG